jgi:hypothetical protein
MLHAQLTLYYGFNERLGLGVGFDQRKYFGGAMDNLIESVHDFLDVHQNGRAEAHHNQSQIILFDEHGNTIFKARNLNRLDNNGVNLIAQYIPTLECRQWPTIGIFGVLRYGLDNPSGEDNHEPLDWSLGIGLSKRLTHRWYSYLHAGYTNYGQTRLLNVEFEEDAVFATLSLAWASKPNFSWLAQYSFHEGVLKHFDELSDPSHELGLGFKWELSEGKVVEFALVENIINYDNSPDFGFHLGYSHRF